MSSDESMDDFERSESGSAFEDSPPPQKKVSYGTAGPNQQDLTVLLLVVRVVYQNIVVAILRVNRLRRQRLASLLQSQRLPQASQSLPQRRRPRQLLTNPRKHQ